MGPWRCPNLGCTYQTTKKSNPVQHVQRCHFNPANQLQGQPAANQPQGQQTLTGEQQQQPGDQGRQNPESVDYKPIETTVPTETVHNQRKRRVEEV